MGCLNSNVTHLPTLASPPYLLRSTFDISILENLKETNIDKRKLWNGYRQVATIYLIVFVSFISQTKDIQTATNKRVRLDSHT